MNWARRFLGAALVASAFLGGVGPAGRAVAVTEGQRLESSTTYRVDAQSGLVRVEATYAVTNTKPNSNTKNGYIEYYFTGLGTPIETNATNVAVTVDDRDVTFEISPLPETPNGRFSGIDIDYGRRLRYQRTFDVRITYELPGEPPRSEDPARVNPAYAAFFAYGFADPGLAAIRIEVPTGWTTEYVGDELTVMRGIGVDIYTAEAIEDSGEFAVLFTARNDAGLAVSNLETPAGHRFEIRSWPGDEEWKSFVTSQLRDGLPALETLIGQKWPETNTTEIVEAFTPYLRGYAGWYDPVADKIEIGEDLDQQTVLHELSHAWFNRSQFAERWINEGFAEEYASKAIEALGGDPLAPEKVEPTDDAAVRLNFWASPTGDADETEDYGYHASFTVARALTDEIGMDKMRAVLDAADRGLTAYPGETTPEVGPRLVDWRRFIDLLEEYGGSTEIDGLLRTWATTSGQNAELDERATVRTQYAALDEAGGAWAPPLFVRRAMNTWEFASARTGIDKATAVLERRATLIALLAQVGVTMPSDLEPAFESATDDLTDVEGRIDAEMAKAEEILRQRAKSGAAIGDARASLERADGFFERLGLRDTDLEVQLSEADAKLAVDQFESANALAASVVDRVDEAERIGKERALKVGGVSLGGVLVLTGLGVGLTHGRRRRKRLRKREAATMAMAPLLDPPLDSWPPPTWAAPDPTTILDPPDRPAPHDPPAPLDG